MNKRSAKKRLVGEVIGKPGEKTVAVEVLRFKQHPKYKKTYSVSKKYLAHDEQDEYQVGDEVEIEEARPVSKKKKWQVVGKIRE